MSGPNVYVDKMKDLVESLLADGHYWGEPHTSEFNVDFICVF